MNDATESAQLAADFNRWITANYAETMSLRAWWHALAGEGWAFPTWPTGLGGRDAPRSAERAVRAVLAARAIPGPPTGIGITMLAPTLIRHGTPAQQKVLLSLARGVITACQLFSEPGAGSDLASLSTRAVGSGEGTWTVNGQKVWSSDAHVADVGMLLARTDPTAMRTHGITYFVIAMDQPGVEVRPLRQMSGHAEFNEVFLTDAIVGTENIVGTVHQGWAVAETTLAAERSGSARATGPTPGERGGWLDHAVGSVTRELQEIRRASPKAYPRSGRAAADLAQLAGRWDDPVIRDRVADLHIMSEAIRALSRRLVESPPPGGASILKLAAAELARRARDLDLDILGEAGMLAGDDAVLGGQVELMALTTHMVSIGGGTDEIQKNILAERVLGLPRDPVRPA